MPDHIEGFLEVGTNDHHEVVINHPDLKADENGAGHIVFSPSQARNLAHCLLRQAEKADSANPTTQTQRQRIRRDIRALFCGVTVSRSEALALLECFRAELLKVTEPDS